MPGVELGWLIRKYNKTIWQSNMTERASVAKVPMLFEGDRFPGRVESAALLICPARGSVLTRLQRQEYQSDRALADPYSCCAGQAGSVRGGLKGAVLGTEDVSLLVETLGDERQDGPVSCSGCEGTDSTSPVGDEGQVEAQGSYSGEL